MTYFIKMSKINGAVSFFLSKAQIKISLLAVRGLPSTFTTDYNYYIHDMIFAEMRENTFSNLLDFYTI